MGCQEASNGLAIARNDIHAMVVEFPILARMSCHADVY